MLHCRIRASSRLPSPFAIFVASSSAPPPFAPTNSLRLFPPRPSRAAPGTVPSSSAPAPFPIPYTDTFDSYPLFSEAAFFADQAGSWEIAQAADVSRGLVMRQTVQLGLVRTPPRPFAPPPPPPAPPPPPSAPPILSIHVRFKEPTHSLRPTSALRPSLFCGRRCSCGRGRGRRCPRCRCAGRGTSPRTPSSATCSGATCPPAWTSSWTARVRRCVHVLVLAALLPCPHKAAAGHCPRCSCSCTCCGCGAGQAHTPPVASAGSSCSARAPPACVSALFLSFPAAHSLACSLRAAVFVHRTACLPQLPLLCLCGNCCLCFSFHQLLP
jgi:hypothetical protein